MKPETWQKVYVSPLFHKLTGYIFSESIMNRK